MRMSITIYNFKILLASVSQFYQVSSNRNMLKLNYFPNFKISHICHKMYMNNVSISHWGYWNFSPHFHVQNEF
jgi:hypothetical protein